MAAPVNVLTQEQQEFVVRQLAAFYTPRDIAIAFVARFPGVKFNENDVLGFDPRKNVLAPELFMLFRTERERVLDDPGAAPYAEQKARLILLSNMVDSYKNNNQYPEARAVLTHIATELGVVQPKGVGGKAPAMPAEAAEAVSKVTRTIVDPAKADPQE
jgi:hypothetical protein